MTPLDTREILFWIAVIAVFGLATLTGMLVNRFLMYRAHRRALAELRRRILEEASSYTEQTL